MPASKASDLPFNDLNLNDEIGITVPAGVALMFLEWLTNFDGEITFGPKFFGDRVFEALHPEWWQKEREAKNADANPFVEAAKKAGVPLHLFGITEDPDMTDPRDEPTGGSL